MYDIQDAIRAEDIIERLKAVAVAAVECITEMGEHDDQSFKEATVDQLEIVAALDNVKAAMSTLAMHRLAEDWGFDLPSDFRINQDGTVWSDAFEDADDE